MKSQHDTDSGTLTIAEFHEALDHISNSHSRYENFRPFIEAAYCALARRTALSRARADELEAAYMAIIKRYSREPDAPRRMAELLGMLGHALTHYHGDWTKTGMFSPQAPGTDSRRP